MKFEKAFSVKHHIRMYHLEDLQRIAKVHRDHGFKVQINIRKGKQYMTFDTDRVKFSSKSEQRSTHLIVVAHVREFFPEAYVTSGMYGPGSFNLTFRINP